MSRWRSKEPGEATLTGREGRVSSTVGPGLVGEVMLPIRGGTEAFNAYPYIGTETLAIGTLVRVAEFMRPRSVFVVRVLDELPIQP